MTEAKNVEVEAIQKKETSTGKTYWLLTLGGDYYSAWKIPEGLQAGDIINYSWHFKGDFRNISTISIEKKVGTSPAIIKDEEPKEEPKEETREQPAKIEQPKEEPIEVKPASEISDIDNIIREGSGLMMKCSESVNEMFEGKRVPEEHKIILINSLFNYVEKRRKD
jgi:hypothetical protein